MAKFRPAYFEPAPKAPPLTAAERKWVTELNRILQACPSKRIGAATGGDARLAIYDREAAEDTEADFDRDNSSDYIPYLKRQGLVLADVHATFNIDSTAV